MPKISEKQKLIKTVKKTTVSSLMNIFMFGNGGVEDDQKVDNILEDASILLAAIESSRYAAPFIRHSVSKALDFYNDVLPNLDEGRFKQFARCSRNQFERILSLIETDNCFDGAHSGKQFPVKMQLLIALYRLGSSGEGATISKMAGLFGIGDGGTIQIVTNRVFSAILNLKNQHITWPDTAERKRIAEETFDELPFCIGYVDGTEIKLAEKPSQDPEAYFSRKSIYSLKVQAVCDNKMKIRHAVIGYPGSIHDARIYNNCDLAVNSEAFFSGSQWIAGDSAYRLTTTVITPFRTNAAYNATKKYKFNKNISQYRIRIEHCFALLKERFSSLKELRLQLKHDACVKKACQWILTCIILHNILIEENGANDFDISIGLSQQMDVLDSPENFLSSEDLSGENKRNAIINLMQI